MCRRGISSPQERRSRQKHYVRWHRNRNIRPMSRFRLAAVSVALLLVSAPFAGCSGDDISDNGDSTLDDFLPELPGATGEPQGSFAGVIETGNTEDLNSRPGVPGRARGLLYAQ